MTPASPLLPSLGRPGLTGLPFPDVPPVVTVTPPVPGSPLSPVFPASTVVSTLPLVIGVFSRVPRVPPKYTGVPPPAPSDFMRAVRREVSALNWPARSLLLAATLWSKVIGVAPPPVPAPLALIAAASAALR